MYYNGDSINTEIMLCLSFVLWKSCEPDRVFHEYRLDEPTYTTIVSSKQILDSLAAIIF